MERNPLGKVLVAARIENLVDVENREQGRLPAQSYYGSLLADRMHHRRAFQFGLKSLLSSVLLTGMVLGIHTCPPPVGPLLMKAAGGIVLFVPVLMAVYLFELFGRRF